jgi:dTDP-4-amino-4,6-dideoxygalactose transaminase
LTGRKNIYLTDSGASALYLILKALTKVSQKKEVVLPAYTAGSLIVAIRKAGLKPVLCDISLEDFNMDPEAIPKALSERTLAVLAVHMFGIVSRGVESLRANSPDGMFIIEDCCQAMGSITGSRVVGASSDVSFFSFNRGKNLPLCGGGFIATDDVFIAKALESQVRGIPEISDLEESLLPVKALAFSIAANPYVYGPGYSIISRFKEGSPPNDIRIRKMGSFHATLGYRLVSRMDLFARKRYENGMYLLNGLRAVDGIALPKIPPGDRPAFNRIPIIFKDLLARERVEYMLVRSGIESSRMYLRALHHMFDLGYDTADFPNARYLAERLLTLPAYPRLKKRDLDRIIRVISGAFK